LGKILLLTGTAPQADGVGGIILADLCAMLPRESVCVAYVPEARGNEVGTPSVPNQIAIRVFPVAYARKARSRFGRVGTAVQRLLDRAANRKSVETAGREIAEWARGQAVTQVWAILDSSVTVELAAGLAAGLGVPLRTTVWDDIHHNNSYFGVRGNEARRLVGCFSDALRRSESCAAIGETMKAEYEQLYGAKAVTILRHGLDARPAARPSGAAVADGRVLIGFAGSVTARSAFDCLLATLDRLRWRLEGREVVLRLLGHRFDLRSKVERHIECYGWRSVDDTVRLLSECDLNYLPQAFEPDWEPFSRLSFPSKLTTYLATGVPVLLHAPKNASLPAFLGRYEFGAWCDRVDADALEATLREALDPARRARFREAAGRALAEEFSRETFRARFAQFLAVDAEELVC
jgi:glycosyltransferase involved in cell wall biosynthesis